MSVCVPLRKRLAGAAVAALLLGALGACSDDPPAEEPVESTPSAAGSPSPGEASESPATEEPSETPYLPVPEGVELTLPGSELELDEPAVVAWKPRQNLTGVLEVTVEELLRTTLKESFVGWQLDKAVTDPRPYFVTASVRNVGDSDLGGQRVPLYLVDDRNRLIEASRFADRFDACPSTPFPKRFAPGDEVDVCLVYLVPNAARLQAASFRPDEEFNPITWTGTVRPLSQRRSDDEDGGPRGKKRERQPRDGGD